MGVRQSVYLDANATTPVDPVVFEAMRPYFETIYGNPSSKSHRHGWEAESAVDLARQRVARLIGARETEIIFTSGATESNALALLGSVDSEPSRFHFISTPIEHPSLTENIRLLRDKGAQCDFLPVDSMGEILSDTLTQTLGGRDPSRTVFLSIGAANHEVGVIQQVKALGERVRKVKGIFHVDATQAVGRIPVNVQEWGVDFMSFSGHKFYGPKGAGVLYARSGNRLKPLYRGGGQEGGLRSGTLNVPAIVGLGMAAKLATEKQESDEKHLRHLMGRFWGQVKTIPGARLLGPSLEDRLPGNLSILLKDRDAMALLLEMREISISTGSACASGDHRPSPILLAIGLSEQDAFSVLRIGFHRFTTEEEVDLAASRLVSLMNTGCGLTRDYKERARFHA